jgi:hypothetical protein
MAATGGAGNAVWWAVAGQVSPQIDSAMGLLEAGWPMVAAADTVAECALLDQVFGELGDPGSAFRKVDVAIGVMMHGAAVGAGGAVGLASGNPGAGILTAAEIEFVYAMAAMLTRAGIADVHPHDAGLGAAVKGLHARLQALMALGAAAGDAALSARIEDIEQQQLELAKERVRAEIDYSILAEHIRANPYHYAQAVWSSLDGAQLADLLAQQGIERSAVQLVISGFFGDRVAVRIKDEVWASENGWNLEAVELLARELAAQPSRSTMLTLPTSGVVVEPAVGECDATDPFIAGHRDLDLRRAEAEVNLSEQRALQEVSETKRYETRVSTDDLAPPEGEAGATIKLSVEGSKPTP